VPAVKAGLPDDYPVREKGLAAGLVLAPPNRPQGEELEQGLLRILRC